MVLLEGGIPMNETLSVFLNLNQSCVENDDALIKKIDKLLLTVGMKYSGIDNMYIPVERNKRDEAVFRAEKLLRSTEWLKGIFAYSLVGTLTNACQLDEIQNTHMSNPSPHKFWYYEQYYLDTKKLPHAIVVDENNCLRDGYISYLLAEKYRIEPDVYESVSNQPLKKVVTGRHVKFENGEWITKSNKKYTWIYTLKNPVVKGDILIVNTKIGVDFICVDKVDYIAGTEFCKEYKKVTKHTNMRMEEGEDTNNGK